MTDTREKNHPGQTPVHLRPKTGNMTGRDAIWFVIRKLQTFTSHEIAVKTKEHKKTIRNYLVALESGGYINRTGRDGHHRIIWELKRDIGVERPVITHDGKPVKRRLSREQMWRAMKILGEFSYQDLAIAASTDDHAVSAQDARHYMRFLANAGYLAPIHRDERGRIKRARFINSMNTGPRPPMVQKIQQVFDPNLGRVMWTASQPEEEQV